MYLTGMFVNDSFYRPYRLLNFDPILVGLFTSFVRGYVLTKLTPPPPESLVEKYFSRRTGS